MGASYRELRAFPRVAQREAGHELESVQNGDPPTDWKPMDTVGPGACEIRVRTHEGGTVHHRVIYVAKFPEAVYVLHAFQKLTRKTAPHNLELAKARYRQMLRERADRKEGR
ncbi:MAG TPA: type II toxin-antitoxin system RelE/ParE family toxin [Longimicrobium sp.]|nr:type II toxin-antitoxin system RelE/ParE family toxin [Longimicrobium sp.]